MLRALFSGVSGLKTHQIRMDVIGNNIANVNTYGFKSSRVSFKDVFYQTTSGASNASGTLGGGNAQQIGYGSMVGTIDVLHTRSGFSPTGQTTDLFIEGEGYFISSDGNGNDQKYSRLGNFNCDGEGNWVDGNSRFLCGYAAKVNADGTPILDADKKPTFDDTKLVPLRNPKNGANKIELGQVSIGNDGTISGVDENGKVIVVGRICLANVPNPQALIEDGNSYLKATSNTGNIQVKPAGDGLVGAVKSGGLEMSNVDLSNEFADMIITQRGFQANSRIITVGDEMLQELVNLKR